jgi:hypothetical protein
MNKQKAPDSKLQAPVKHQAPTIKSARARFLKLQNWGLAGIWSLVFGI